MTVSEKHIAAARDVFRSYLRRIEYDRRACFEHDELMQEMIAAALAAAERNGLRGFVTTFHFGNTHSPDTPPGQVNSPASNSSPEPGTPFSSQVFSMSSPANTAGSDGCLCPATHHASRNGEG